MDRRERIDDPQTALVAALMGWQSKLWTAMPGTVLSFDPAKATCSVQLGLKMKVLNPDGSERQVSVAPLVDCPVVFPGGGGFTLTFPVAAGDDCLVVLASRCIDSWWDTSAGDQQQSEFRMHDLSDGFVIPRVFRRPNVIGSISATDVQLRSDDGTASVTIDAAKKIKLVAPAEVDVTAPSIKLIGNVTITGDLAVSGTAVVALDLTAAGKSVSTHIHGGVSLGSDSTAPPT